MAQIRGEAVKEFLISCGIDFKDVFRVVFEPDEVLVFRFHRNAQGEFYIDPDIGDTAMRMETIGVTHG